MQHVIDTINEQLDELESYAEKAEKRNDAVSKWSVGQQIEHSLIAISGMAVALKKEHPGVGSRGPNDYRELVFASKTFPRGAIEAPAISHPSDDPTSDVVQRLLQKTRSRLGDPLGLSPQSTIIHPIMGVLYRDEVLEFMTIHTAHHLSIIRDILA